MNLVNNMQLFYMKEVKKLMPPKSLESFMYFLAANQKFKKKFRLMLPSENAFETILKESMEKMYKKV